MGIEIPIEIYKKMSHFEEPDTTSWGLQAVTAQQQPPSSITSGDQGEQVEQEQTNINQDQVNPDAPPTFCKRCDANLFCSCIPRGALDTIFCFTIMWEFLVGQWKTVLQLVLVVLLFHRYDIMFDGCKVFEFRNRTGQCEQLTVGLEYVTTDDGTDDGSKSNLIPIIGGVFGALVLLIAATAGAVYYKKNQGSMQGENNGESHHYAFENSEEKEQSN